MREKKLVDAAAATARQSNHNSTKQRSWARFNVNGPEDRSHEHNGVPRGLVSPGTQIFYGRHDEDAQRIDLEDDLFVAENRQPKAVNDAKRIGNLPASTRQAGTTGPKA